MTQGTPIERTTPLGRLALESDLDIDRGGPNGPPSAEIVRAVLEDVYEIELPNDRAVHDVLDVVNQPRAVSSVIVAWDGRIGPLEVGARADGAVLVGDDGTSLAAHLDGSTITFDEPLPYGMHTLSVGWAGRESLATVISAPSRLPTPQPGMWGVYASAFALRGTADLGIGDFTALGQLAESIHGRGGHFVATLPVLPLFVDAPVDITPFTPITRTAWNELHVDLAKAPGAEAIEDVVVEPPERTPRLVDYPEVARRQRHSLRAYARVVGAHPALRAELDRFLVLNPNIAQYARFRALGETLSRDWRRWPAPWRHGDLSNAPVDGDIELMHQVGQWLASTQMTRLIDEMRDRGQRLQLELPVGTHPLGYDVWADQSSHCRRTRVLEAPDGSAPGMDTGHLALRTWRDRRRGHRTFAAAVHHHARGGFLRIDQISELWRSWVVPDGADPGEGVYLRHRPDELLAIVSLECHRAGAVVTAGNLSTATADVRDRLADFGAMAPLLDGRRCDVDDDDLPVAVHRSGDAALIHLDEVLAGFGPASLDPSDDESYRVRHPRGINATLDDERVAGWFDDFVATWTS